MTDAILAARDIVKSLGGRRVIDGVGLELHKGSLVALLGPNGAGKTTLISIMTGLRRPDAGIVRLFGRDPREPRARLPIGVTPQVLGFPRGLKVSEVIDLVRGHAADPVPTEALVARFALAPLMSRMATSLSGGEMRLVALAIAFCRRPALVFLDEPTTGLDIGARQLAWREIRGYVAGGGSIVLTTHYLEEADALADRVIVLNQGIVVEAGGVADIRARLAVTRVRFRTAAPLADGAYADAGLRATADGYVAETQDADALVKRLTRDNVAFHDLEVTRLGLEAAVLHLVERPR